MSKIQPVVTNQTKFSFYSLVPDKKTTLEAAKITAIAVTCGIAIGGATWGVYSVGKLPVNVYVVAATGLVGAITAVLARTTLFP